MSMPDFLDDHRAVIIKFEFGIKSNSKVNETIGYFDGVIGEGGEGFPEVPSEGDVISAQALELRGIEENHNFTFRCRKSYAVLKAPELGVLDESEELGMGVCNETEVVNKKENADEEGDVGGEEWNDKVRESLLEGPDKIRDIESPKERRETTTFSEAFEDSNERGGRGEIVVDAVLQVCVKGAKMLPKRGWYLKVT